MEYGSRTMDGAGGCMVYMNPYPLEAGNPYRDLQMEMYHRPYQDQDYWVPCYGWWGILPPPGACPIGHSYSWSVSTNGTGL